MLHSLFWDCISDLVTFLHGEDENFSSRDSARRGLATAKGGPRQPTGSTSDEDSTRTGDQY